MTENRLREVEIDLASHLKECAANGRMVWAELLNLRDEQRRQSRILWGILISIMTTLATVCGVLVKAQFHL